MSDRKEAQTEAVKFWDRDDIRGVQRFGLDVWATIKWHWRMGGRGVPTLDWINGQDEPRTRRIVEGTVYTDIGISTAIRHAGWVRINKSRKNPEGDRVWQQWIEHARIQPPPATHKDGAIPESLIRAFGVETYLATLGNPIVLRELLMHRYPQRGPAVRFEKVRAYRRFRPPVLMKPMLGALGGKSIEKNVDEMWGSMEREFLEGLISWLPRQ